MPQLRHRRAAGQVSFFRRLIERGHAGAGAVQIFACMDDIKVVAEGATAADALRVAQELRPDVMLLDISLPGDGLDAAASIARTSPGVRTVMLTASESELDV